MTYTVNILRSSQRQLARIDLQDQPRLISAIEALADDPRPSGCRKLTGRDAWHIRVGTYRVIYELDDDRLRVLVVAAGHRGGVYR